MKLIRRAAPAVEAEEIDDETEDAFAQRKGRPTPKRRDSQGRRGPVSAPKTRKEAYARQKQQTREQRTTKTSAKPRTVAEQRAALKRGDPDALPKRDQGPTKKLARDYVDSTRMFSNYLLWLFPLFIILSLVPALKRFELLVMVILIGMVVEMYVVGRRIRKLAVERNGEAQGTPWSVGWYAGSRGYMPRRWRLPAPQVARGDEI